MARRLPDAFIRLRVCHEAGIQPGRDVVGAVLAYANEAEAGLLLRDMRDSAIRSAAALLDGLPWSKAGVLVREAAALDRSWRIVSREEPVTGTVRGELHAARLHMELPCSQRGFYRVIANH